MNGAGSCGPGPGAAGGPGGNAGGSENGAGGTGSVRAPGGASGSGTGVPGTFGGGVARPPGDRDARRGRQTVRVRRRRLHVDRRGEDGAAERADGRTRAGQRIPRPRQPASPMVTLPLGFAGV